MDEEQVSATVAVSLEGTTGDFLGFVKVQSSSGTLDSVFVPDQELNPTRELIFNSIVSALQKKADLVGLGSGPHPTIKNFLKADVGVAHFR